MLPSSTVFLVYFLFPLYLHFLYLLWFHVLVLCSFSATRADSLLRARRPLLPKAYHNSRDNYLVLLSNNTRRSSYITTANCAALALLTQYDRRLAAAKLSLYVMMMMMASLKICSCIDQKCFAAFLSASFRLPSLCSCIHSFPLLNLFTVAPPQPSSCPTYSQHQLQLIWMSYNPNETHCSLICNCVLSIPCILL